MPSMNLQKQDFRGGGGAKHVQAAQVAVQHNLEIAVPSAAAIFNFGQWDIKGRHPRKF